MVRALVAFTCVALSTAFRSRQESFPTDVWEEVTEVTCDQLEDRAKERMGKYRGACGVGSSDMDSGAVGFALLRPGAEKLCKCEAVNLEELQEDRKNIQEQGCSGGIFGPVGEMDRIYDECKQGTLDLGDFNDGEDKLSEDEDEVEEEPEEPAPAPAPEPVKEPRWEFSGPIKFTQVGGSTDMGDAGVEYCLAVDNGAVTQVGAEVYGTDCKVGDMKQVWFYNQNSEGRLQIGDENLCLAQKGEGLALAACTPSNNAQEWVWMNAASGARMVKNKKSHKCFGLRYKTDFADGKKVTSWACQKAQNQALQLCNKDSKKGCAGHVW